jgi:hypothetical protein
MTMIEINKIIWTLEEVTVVKVHHKAPRRNWLKEINLTLVTSTFLLDRHFDNK